METINLFILDKNFNVLGTLSNTGDFSKIIPYYEDLYTQDLTTGAEVFEFTTSSYSRNSQYLTIGNYIAFKYNNEYKLFNIISIEENHEETLEKTVYCEMAGIELINQVVRPMKVVNNSVKKFLESILSQTDWQLGKIDAGFTQIMDFETTEHHTVYELIQEHVVGTFGAEISYRVEIENNQIAGKYIDVYKQRGRDNGYRFAYSKNIETISRTIDSSELVTALIGEGKNGLTFKEVDLPDKPINQDFIANETAYKQWNLKGTHLMGIHKCDTESPQELLRLTRIALEERSQPKAKYEVKVALIDNNLKIGDTVNIIDHEFNPPLYLSGRVTQLKTSVTDPNKNECILSNFKELNSNITDEMRKLASQLEGYVDNQFPIGGDKIAQGAVGKEQFSKQYHTEIVSDAVYASLVQTEDLIANKADIGDLTAINANIENLKAENVEITGQLNATNANIENLKAENAEITGSLYVTNAKVENLFVDKANITDLNATNAKVDSLQADKASINQLNAVKAEIGELVATKADIQDLTAISGKIDVLESSKANISDLNAMNATIGSLQANKADIVELNAVKGNITQLESEVAKIGVLESDVADIEHILAGNITADNISSGTITAGSSIIANGAIGNAQISSIDAGKISAGTVDTSKVTIQGADSHLRIKGNRLQVFQGVGNQAKERVTLGDVNGNGSIYGLRVRGADGTTILIDENGVTNEGITDGSITNDKISDDANIDGAKLNINSVVTKINEDGTETINSTKIDVNGTNLDTKLSSITTKQTQDGEKIAQAQSQITANTNAIKLKVDEQTYQTDKKGTQTSLDKHTSEINALKGEISLKVDRTGVEEIIDEVSGELIDSKIDTAKAEIKVTTDKISQNVSNLTNTVNTKADGSTVTTINNKVGSLETSVNGISGKVTNLEKTTTNLGNSINGVQGEVDTLKSDVASLEVTTSGISQKVSSVESTTASLSTQVTTAQNTANQAKTDASTANSNATNALNKANSANTLADSKAKVFTSTPTVPYKVGDLWVQGTTGEIMRCKTARTSGSYTASDWEKASKYTDDTKANAVDGKVTTLQGTVNSTSSKVATLETNLNGITQRVSSTESTTATLTTKINEVEDVANTSNTNATNALNKANSASAKADSATTEVTKTNQKVASIETNLNGITSRVSNVETKTNTIEGKVNSHESRLTTAESKITDKAIINTVSSTIDNKVSDGIKNVQIGDRNLLLMDNVVNREGVNFSKDGYTVSFTHRAEWQGIQFLNLRETMELGKEYCLQYKIKKVEGTLNGISHHVDAQFEIIDYVVDGKLQNATAHVGNMGMNDTNWHTCTLRVKRKTDATGDGTNRIIAQPNRGVATSVTVEMKDFKISQGNKFGDWSPAPEDVERQLSDIETMLNGNIDSAISGTKSEILDDVSKKYANKEIVTQLQETVNSKFEQTSTDITMQFNTAQNYTKEVDGKLQDYQNTVATHIRFSENGIDLGKTNSPFSATLDNTKLAFKQNGEEIAYISNNKMYITQAEVKESLRIGKSGNGFFSWVQGSEGNLSLRWSES